MWYKDLDQDILFLLRLMLKNFFNLIIIGEKNSYTRKSLHEGEPEMSLTSLDDNKYKASVNVLKNTQKRMCLCNDWPHVMLLAVMVVMELVVMVIIKVTYLKGNEKTNYY